MPPAKPIHEQMQRVYYAVLNAGLIGGEHPQAELAAILKVTSQVVNNWDARGPAPAGLLKLQEVTGVNATWVITGQGPMFVTGMMAPRARDALTKMGIIDADASRPADGEPRGRSIFGDLDENRKAKEAG
jgi:hypothetical protein